MQTLKDQSFGIIPVFKKTDGTFLFCLVQHQGEHYGFPKGHANLGETEEATARRELEEETGIAYVEIMSKSIFIQTYQFEYQGTMYDKTVRYFLGFVLNTATKIPEEFKKEISDMKWLPYEEAREVLKDYNADILIDQAWEFLKNKTV